MWWSSGERHRPKNQRLVPEIAAAYNLAHFYHLLMASLLNTKQKSCCSCRCRDLYKTGILDFRDIWQQVRDRRGPSSRYCTRFVPGPLTHGTIYELTSQHQIPLPLVRWCDPNHFCIVLWTSSLLTVLQILGISAAPFTLPLDCWLDGWLSGRYLRSKCTNCTLNFISAEKLETQSMSRRTGLHCNSDE